MNSLKVWQAVSLIALVIIRETLSQTCTMKGCESSTYTTQSDSCICSVCQSGFALTTDKQCQSSQCYQNNQYLKQTSAAIASNSNQGQCVSVCNTNQLPNTVTNTCDTTFQCTETFIQDSQTNQSRTIQFVLYSPSDNLIFLVYDSFLNAIDSSTGSFMRTFSFPSGASSLTVLDNQLFLLKVATKQILQWDPYSSSTEVVAKIANGDFKTQSQIFRFQNSQQYAISSFDSSNLIIYFSEINSSQSDISSFTSITLSSLNELLYTYENFIVLQRLSDYQIKIAYVIQQNNTPKLIYPINQFVCQNIKGAIVSSLSISFQNQYMFFMIFGNTSSIYIQMYLSGGYQCINLPTTDGSIPQQISALQIDFCGSGVMQQIIFVKLSSFKIIAYTVSSSANYLNEYFEITLTSNIVSYTTVVNNNQLLIYSITSSNNIYIHSVSSSQCTASITLNVQSVRQFAVSLTSSQKLYSLQKISNSLQYQSVLLTSYNTYIIIPSSQSPFLLVKDFYDKVQANESTVAAIVYMENIGYIASCSIEGKVILWRATDPLAPRYLYTISRPYPCLQIKQFQTNFLVVHFAVEIAIFNVQNILQTKSYPILHPLLYASIATTSNYIYIFCDQQAYVLSGYNTVVAVSQLSTYPTQFSSVSQIFVSQTDKIIVYTPLFELIMYDFDITNNIVNGVQLHYFKNPIQVYLIQLFNLESGGFVFAIYDYAGVSRILDSNLSSLNVFQITVGTAYLVTRYQQYIIYSVKIFDITKISQYTLIVIDMTTFTNFQIGQFFVLYGFVQFKSLKNSLGQDTLTCLNMIPAQNTSFTVQILWTPSLNKVDVPFAHLTYSPQQTMVNAITDSKNSILLSGNLSGEVRVIPTSNKLDIQNVFSINLQSTDLIQKIVFSAALEQYFVVNSKIQCYSMYTDALLETIIFPSTVGSTTIQPILGFYASDTHNVIIAFLNQELIVRNFSTTLLSYAVSSSSLLQYINGFYLDETTSEFFIYGDNLIKISLTLDNIQLVSIKDSTVTNFSVCQFVTEIISCRASSTKLVLYSRTTLTQITVITTSETNFLISLDTSQKYILIYNTALWVYTYTGTLLQSINTFANSLLGITFCDYFFVLKTTPMAYMINRQTLSIVGTFSAPGGVLRGMIFLPDWQQIGFFSEDLSSGQIIFLNTITFQQIGFMVNTYDQVGFGKIIKIIYDVDSQMLNYIDNFGNNQNIITSTKGVDNTQSITDIQQGVQKAPIDHVLDFKTNTVLIHNGYSVWKINYNLQTRQSRRLVGAPRKHYIQLTNNNAANEDRAFLIADYNNTVFYYQDYQVTYYCQFSQEIIELQTLYSGTSSLQIVFYQLKILVFQNYLTMQTESSALYSLNQYTYKQLLLRDPQRLILNTIDNQIVDYDFFNKVLLFSVQLSSVDDITITLTIGTSVGTVWKLFYGTQTGKIGSYDLLAQVHTSIQLQNAIPIQQLYQLDQNTILSVDTSGIVTMINLTNLVQSSSQNIMNALNNQITLENGSLISKQIQLMKVDSLNHRLYVNFFEEKKVGIWNTKDYSFIKYLMFPDDQWKFMILSSDYIILSSAFQFNIYNSTDFSFFNYIRRYNRKDRMTNFTLIDTNKLIAVYTTRIEILFIDNSSRSIKLLDTITLTDPYIIYSQVNSTTQQLVLVGISKTSIFEKRYALSIIQKPYLLGNSNSNQLQCYAELTFKNQAQLQNQFELSYNPNVPNQSYIFQVLLYNELRTLDALNKTSSVIIMRPITSANNILNIRSTSFTTLNFDISLQGFNLNFVDQSVSINTNANSNKIVMQDINIINQSITDTTSILLENKSEIILQNVLIKNINITGSTSVSRMLGQSSGSNSLFTILNSTSIYIENMVIQNLNFVNSQASLFLFNQFTNLTIKSLVIQNSQFDCIFNMIQGQSISINNLTISDSYRVRTTYSNALYAFNFVGIQGINLSTINVYNNKDIFIFQTKNQYNLNGQIVYLSNDQIQFNSISISKINYTLPFDSSLNMINLQSSFVNIISANSEYNQGNILINQTTSVYISSSKFFNNTGITGGALQVISLSQNLIIANSSFTRNWVVTSGGGIYLQNVAYFSIDSMSSLETNMALIGGAIRIFNKNTTASASYFIKSKMKYNSAAIYGDDVGDILNNILVYTLPSSKSTTNLTLSDLDLKYRGPISESGSNITISSVQSGGYLLLYVQLLDNTGNVLNVDQNKYSNNLYHPNIKSELDSYFLEFTYNQNQLSTLDIKGETLLSMRQFDFNLKMFIFSSLSVTSLPLQKQVQSVLQISYQQANFVTAIAINLEFRACQEGEVLVYSSKSQVNVNNTVSLVQMISCSDCSFGTYSFINPMDEYTPKALQALKTDSYQAFSTCKKCPASAFQCEENSIILEQGYWRSGRNSDEIIECNKISPEICDEQSANSKEGCIEGYMGPLCETCDSTGEVWNGKRFTPSLSNFQCYECSDTSIQLLFLALSTVALFLYLFFSTIFFTDRYVYHSTCYYLRVMGVIPFSKSCTLDHSSYFVKILINYLQISTLLYTQNINITPQFMNIVPNTTGKPGSQIIISSTCLFGIKQLQTTGLEKVRSYSMSIFPLTIVFFLFVVLFIMKYFSLWRVNNYHKYTMLTVAYLFFQPDSIGFFTKAISCRSVGSESYQQINNLIACSDESYNIFSYYFVLPNLIFWSLSPGLLFYFFYKRKGKNNERLNHCITKFMFGYFYLEYKEQYYYWEFIRIYFKIALVLITTLLNNIAIQIVSLYIILIFIYVVLIMKLKPFESQALNNLEIMSYIIIIPCLFFFQLYQLLQINIFQLFTAVIHYCYLAYIIFLIVKIKLKNQNNPINIAIKNCFKRNCPIYIYNAIKPNESNNQNALRRWRLLAKNLKKARLMALQMSAVKKSYIGNAFKSGEQASLYSGIDLVEQKRFKNDVLDSPIKIPISGNLPLESYFSSGNFGLDENMQEQASEKKFSKNFQISIFSPMNHKANSNNDVQSTHTRMLDSIIQKKDSKFTNDDDSVSKSLAVSNGFSDHIAHQFAFAPHEDNHESCNKVYDFNLVFSKTNSSPTQIKKKSTDFLTKLKLNK